jgi:hypothetical protein
MTRSSGDGSQPARQAKKSKQVRDDSSAADLGNLGPIIEEVPAAINSTESETPGSRQIEHSMLERLEAMIHDLQGSNERLRRDQLAAQEVGLTIWPEARGGPWRPAGPHDPSPARARNRPAKARPVKSPGPARKSPKARGGPQRPGPPKARKARPEKSP